MLLPTMGTASSSRAPFRASVATSNATCPPPSRSLRSMISLAAAVPAPAPSSAAELRTDSEQKCSDMCVKMYIGARVSCRHEVSAVLACWAL